MLKVHENRRCPTGPFALGMHGRASNRHSIDTASLTSAISRRFSSAASGNVEGAYRYQAWVRFTAAAFSVRIELLDENSVSRQPAAFRRFTAEVFKDLAMTSTRPYSRSQVDESERAPVYSPKLSNRDHIRQ